ncbi:MAG: PHP domain-containing protein [Gemmatimonadales bacterium]|nr:PHP domain-containing protein [Gemmatimonadales bacterium]
MIDLHVHSTASDGACAPADVVARAAAAGLTVIALTDHDTLAGIEEAAAVGETRGVRVIAGCEFSVRAGWGEMHLLAYFLPADDAPVTGFLEDQRDKRRTRASRMVAELGRLGLELTFDEVLTEAGQGAVGRPHVARALVRRGHVDDVTAAFRKYIGWRRPAFVPKDLPSVEAVTALVRQVGGVTSAAHLGDRATRRSLARLRRQGVDAIEVRHPLHNPLRATQIEQLAAATGMLCSGGTDWHGEPAGEPNRAPLGSIVVPQAWLEGIEALHHQRLDRGV